MKYAKYILVVVALYFGIKFRMEYLNTEKEIQSIENAYKDEKARKFNEHELIDEKINFKHDSTQLMCDQKYLMLKHEIEIQYLKGNLDDKIYYSKLEELEENEWHETDANLDSLNARFERNTLPVTPFPKLLIEKRKTSQRNYKISFVLSGLMMFVFLLKDRHRPKNPLPYNQPQTEQIQSGLGYTPDPRQQAEQRARANIEQIMHNEGNVQTFTDPKGKEFAILSETPGGMAVVIDQSGNKSTMATSDLKNRKVQTAEEAFAEQMQLYDQENQPEEQNTFNFNGKKYNVVDFTEEGSWIASELDENGQPTGNTIEVSQEDQLKVLEQLQANTQTEPQLNTIQVGKKQYTFTPSENNSLISKVYKSAKAAKKARADIEAVLGNNNDIAIIYIENPDSMQPDAFTVLVTPKTNLSENTGENFEFDSLLFSQNNGLKVELSKPSCPLDKQGNLNIDKLDDL